ncbi:MAG: glutathione peroxidase [Bdellovibrionales bacterium]
MEKHSGNLLLIVNIATQCGYTPQLDGLEKLYGKYKDKGFKVVGVPSNEFGGQTPENDEDVKKFCKLNFGVSFPIEPKTNVKGSDIHPEIKKLIESSENKAEIAWNFEKFLVDKNGALIARFKSGVKPMDEELISLIEKNL